MTPTTPAEQRLPVEGERWRLTSDVERGPHFIASAGSAGTVTESTRDLVRLRLDDHLPGAEEWDNEVCWAPEDCRDLDHRRDVLDARVAAAADASPIPPGWQEPPLPFADVTLDGALELARGALEDDNDAHPDEVLLRLLYDLILEQRRRPEFVVVATSFSDWRGDSWIRGPFPSEEAAHEWAKSNGLEDATDCSREGDVGDEYLVRQVVSA